MAKTGLKQRMIEQFHHPRGIGGRVAGWVMAHRGSNRQRNIWVVGLLDVQPEERVLEVGFGPGIALGELAARATRGRVYGVDHSAVMVQRASRRTRAAADRIELIHASVDRLPSFGEPLDAVLAVNSSGFWPDPPQRLRELRGLLRPGGRIALASQPRCPGAERDTTTRAAGELQNLLAKAGFTDLRVETLDLDPPVACVLGVTPR
ncbi:methyltransferase domain-containing protein [Amycolatopsis sp. NPDC051061]|uniref:class I SAM-dependent methyltransferase n=1 Tax=Amycolatopsis sp. NPDC051061 TaxID=3155042 RepID=UPI00343FA92E